jgi:hypothetical protein
MWRFGLRTWFVVVSGVALVAAAAGGAWGAFLQVLTLSLLFVSCSLIGLALLLGWPIVVIWACQSISRFWTGKPSAVSAHQVSGPPDRTDRTVPSDRADLPNGRFQLPPRSVDD